MVELAWLPNTARWSCERPEPLTLRAWMASPVAWDSYHGLPLEGALQDIVVQLASGQTSHDAFAGVPMEQDVPLPIPIEDVDMCGYPIAMASWAQPSPDAIETIRMRRKRTRAEELRANVVRVNGGPYKSLNLAIPTLTAAWLDWHVVGDRAKLTELLPYVAHIGRARAGGLGLVLGWEILDDPEHRSITDKGRLMRTIPAEAGIKPKAGTYATRPETTRAPYWVMRSRCEAMVPIARLP